VESWTWLIFKDLFNPLQRAQETHPEAISGRLWNESIPEILRKATVTLSNEGMHEMCLNAYVRVYRIKRCGVWVYIGRL
jgi:hypothetical protein